MGPSGYEEERKKRACHRSADSSTRPIEPATATSHMLHIIQRDHQRCPTSRSLCPVNYRVVPCTSRRSSRMRPPGTSSPSAGQPRTSDRRSRGPRRRPRGAPAHTLGGARPRARRCCLLRVHCSSLSGTMRSSSDSEMSWCSRGTPRQAGGPAPRAARRSLAIGVLEDAHEDTGRCGGG